MFCNFAEEKALTRDAIEITINNNVNNMTKVQIINRGHHDLPTYATALSAGMDLRANISEPIADFFKHTA